MATVEERLAQLEAENQRLRLQNVDPAQRPAYEAQMQLEAERRALAAEREQLNQAARVIRAHDIAQKTGANPEELLKHDDLEQAGIDYVAEMLNDPVKAQSYADFLKRTAALSADPTQAPAPGAPGAPAASAPGAPAASAAPAGAAGASGGTSTPGPDPSQAILEKFKGTGKLSDYLAALRTSTPATTVVFGGVPQASDINYTSAAAAGNPEQNPPPSGGAGAPAATQATQTPAAAGQPAA